MRNRWKQLPAHGSPLFVQTLGMRRYWPLALLLLLPTACGGPITQAATTQPVSPAPRAPVQVASETSCGLPAFRETLLRRINAERAKRQSCGLHVALEATPLVWNEQLLSAAARHSTDMARRDYFEHASPEGQRVGQRVSREGYPWRAVGENIASGDRTVDAVMNGWMRSPSHCSNLMQPAFTEVGVACVIRPGSTPGAYWTMVLGKKR